MTIQEEKKLLVIKIFEALDEKIEQEITLLSAKNGLLDKTFEGQAQRVKNLAQENGMRMFYCEVLDILKEITDKINERKL